MIRLISLQGRMSRLPYLGCSLLLAALWVAIQMAVASMSGGGAGSTLGSVDPRRGAAASELIAFLVLAWPSICIGVQRLHDTGRTGLWLLVGLLPVANVVLWLYMLFWPGSRDTNDYGPPPGRGMRAV